MTSMSLYRVPPDVGLAPSTTGGPSPSTPPRTPPPHQTEPPRPGLPEHCKKSQGGCGEKGGEGRALAWGKGPPIAMGEGGGPPNTSWGQTHIWGLPTLKQVVLASRDVIISGQIWGLKLQRVFTLGDGCWLPITVFGGLRIYFHYSFGFLFFEHQYSYRIYRSSQNYYRQSCYSWEFIFPKLPLPLPSWNSDEFPLPLPSWCLQSPLHFHWFPITTLKVIWINFPQKLPLPLPSGNVLESER